MEEQSIEKKSDRANNVLIIVIAALAAASILYRLFVMGELTHSSLLFVGIPALLSLIILRFSGKPQTLYGIVFKTITLFLLISGIILGEGLICVLMAAPIFYGVAGILTFIYKRLRDSDRERLSVWVLPAVIVFLMAPVDEFQEEEIQAVVTEMPIAQDVDLSLLRGIVDLDKDLPLFFKAGFPQPVSWTDMENGSIEIDFESSTRGVGSLVFEVEQKSEEHILFHPTQDNSHIGRWMEWEKVEVQIIEDPDGQRTLRWTSHFRCKLGPGWYFRPMERWAVGLSNEHLMNCYFVK